MHILIETSLLSVSTVAITHHASRDHQSQSIGLMIQTLSSCWISIRSNAWGADEEQWINSSYLKALARRSKYNGRSTWTALNQSTADLTWFCCCSLPTTHRLLKGGFSQKEMAAVVREIRVLKHKRMVSQQQVSLDNMHESVEKVTHGLKKLFVFRKSDYQKKLEAQCQDLAVISPSRQNNKYALSAWGSERESNGWTKILDFTQFWI